MMDGDELGAVGEGRFDLDLGNHLGAALAESRTFPASAIIAEAFIASS